MPLAVGALDEACQWYANTHMAQLLHESMALCYRSTQQSVEVSAQAKSEAPLAILEWCVEAEDESPIVTYRCWQLVRGMKVIYQHSRGILPLSTHVIMLQNYPAIC